MNENASKEDRIRHEAYRIWLAEGRPIGRDKEHWEEAERNIGRIERLASEDEHADVPESGAPLGPGQA